MSNVYKPEEVGVKPPAGGFQQGGWYGGRQFWGGTLSEAGVIHPESNQQGAGQTVSNEVNAASAALQGTNLQGLTTYINNQNASASNVTPAANIQPTNIPGMSLPGKGTVTPTASTGTITPPATPDLMAINDQLNKDSGIKDLEAQLIQKQKEFADVKAAQYDNPYLDEATLVGRIAKLEKAHTERTANLQSEIQMKKADVEMKLNLTMKQFDINSTAAQQGLQQFTTLLEAGALNNVSGETIAQFTRSTGLPSDVLLSAINTQKQKNIPTQVITSTADDGTVTAVVLNTQTGEIIKQADLGRIGNAQNGSATAQKQAYIDMAKQDAHDGVILSKMFAIYSGYLTPDEIYTLYNSTSKYGPDKGDISALAKYGVTQPKDNSTIIIGG